MLRPLDTIWAACLVNIKKHINEQSYRTWFEPIKPVKLDNKVITIQVPSQFFYEWLEEHYVALLQSSIQKELGESARLEYQIVVAKQTNHSAAVNIKVDPNHPNYKKELEKHKKDEDPKSIHNPFVIPGIKNMNIESQLNGSHTFETFVEGECNQLARSAGVAVANKPGKTSFNPLVLYGGVGLGKTHLAQAIGNYVKNVFPRKTVLYVSSERFTNQFIEAVKSGGINEFTAFYQMIDVLIVDDIQFFANKDRTQDIFFHTFNHLHHSGKQLILTSDRPPRDLEGMEERLLSRFKWGLTADLQAPDLETRIAILEKKLQADGIEISREVVELIATQVKTNVRELEGALISILGQSSLKGEEVSLALAQETIRSLVRNIPQKLSPDFVQTIVCEYLNVTVAELTSKSRKRHIAQARQIAMYLIKETAQISLTSIGRHFGGRDHSTVSHAIKSVEKKMKKDEVFYHKIADLQNTIKVRSFD